MSTGRPPHIRQRWMTLLAALILAALTIVVHARVLSSWWLVDDPQIILQAARNSVPESFFVAPAWRTLSSSNFTPLVTLSFEVDLALFGMSPRAFYGHQLVSITLAALALFLLLRRFARDEFAFLGAGAFLLSPAAHDAAGALMLRHYVEGLALALIALILWDRGASPASADRRETVRELLSRACPTAVIYLVAMLAKEVFAPLPLLMIAVSVSRRERVRRLAIRLVPSAMSATLYLLWRSLILGSLGGYGERSGDLTGSMKDLWGAISGPLPGIFSIALLVTTLVVLIIAAARQGSRASFVVALSVAFAILPLLAVLGSIVPRYGVIPSVLMVGLLAIGLDRWSRRSIAIAVLLIVSAALFRGAMLQEGRESSNRRMMIAEGRYIWEAEPSGSVLFARSPEWYIEGIADLRRIDGRGESPGFVLSITPVSLGVIDEARLVNAARDGSIVPLDEAVARLAEREHESFVADDSLSVIFRREENDVSWELGPRCDCHWTFLSLPNYEDVVIRSSGRRRVPEPLERSLFRVRRDDSSGHWTISPPLPFPDEGETTKWNRSEEVRRPG